MKLLRFGAFAALAGTAVIGCSSTDSPKGGEGNASISAKLRTTEGVVITEVSWDLNTSPGNADVANDTVPVPNDNSVINLSIQSLPGGNYSVVFSATGTYTPASGPVQNNVPCVSAPTVFNLPPNTDLALPPIDLICQVNNFVGDSSSSVDIDVGVVVETINVDNNIVEVFSYGPRSVTGVKQADDTCAFPPVKIKVYNNDATISYSWAAASGTFNPSPLTTSGTFTCAGSGDVDLTVTATRGAVTASKTVTVQCGIGDCGPVVCGDGVVGFGEQCDEGATPSSRCTDCQITPVCGDGVQDGPSGACSGGVNDPDCSEQCDTAGPTATCSDECEALVPICGDGILGNTPGEVCDDGDDNSNTAPDACRTNCQPASCGDNVVDTDEECDAGPTGSATCSTSCEDIGGPVPGPCGDGVVNVGEGCDDGENADGFSLVGGCTESCKPVAGCFSCIAASPDLGPFQQTYCLDGYPGGECTAIETCIIDSGCGYPVPGQCYCGPNTSSACEDPGFVPTGSCTSLIRAATGNVSNAETLALMPLLSNASGVAFAVTGEAAQPAQCFSACFAD